MQRFRNFLYRTYAVAAVVCLQGTLLPLLPAFRSPASMGLRRTLTLELANLGLGLIFGMAWWTVWKQKKLARLWGTAASLILLLVDLVIVLYTPFRLLPVSGLVGVLFLVALVLYQSIGGLIVFGRSQEAAAGSQARAGVTKIAGDGTNKLVNSSAAIILGLAYVGAWEWCGYWMAEYGVPVSQANVLFIFVVSFLIILIHEFGHTIAGLLFGMKLRLLLVGPFRWQKREGKWEFKFEIGGLLADTGGTGVVPMTSEPNRWRDVSVTLAGPIANFIAALVALPLAFLSPPDAPVQTGGFLVLFGAFNLVCFATNLIPLRFGNQYSDGARLYQTLSNGPWGEYHRATSIVLSSLVTPLRPRDFDAGAIERASQGITQGNHAMILRLWAYSHALDCNRHAEALQALMNAEVIFRESAGSVPVELYTVFVFGNAYVKRDAAAARVWWEQMEIKKPTRLNVDYWRAKSALNWIEGNAIEAEEAWSRSNTLAERLPAAGAYEFDRMCCALLRRAMSESQPATS
ncbi:MAG TPA: M50 family metallopeptidase [Terracidiphilus sp.]|nr:M50 family metallopeptidase [Terracidiphilus sp.]